MLFWGSDVSNWMLYAQSTSRVIYIGVKGSGAPPLSTTCVGLGLGVVQVSKCARFSWVVWVRLRAVGFSPPMTGAKEGNSCPPPPFWGGGGIGSIGQKKGTPPPPPPTHPFFFGGGGVWRGRGRWQQQYWYCGRKGWGAQGLWACSGWVNDQLVNYLPQSDLSAGSGTDSVCLHTCKLSQIINEHFCVCYI